MSASPAKLGITLLRWVLGVVILIESVLFILSGAAHDFARMHMPDFVRLILGVAEILGCILLLVPRSAVRGAWLLLAVFVMAILIHLLHGAYNVGNLAIYAAAAFAIAVGKEN
jgi:uncharacterized membrane protein YphA (DoxX/SURF4 family)